MMDAIIIQPGDTLLDLFGEYWTYVYNDPKNKSFRLISPNPDKIQPGQIIYVKDEYAKNIHIQIQDNPNCGKR